MAVLFVLGIRVCGVIPNERNTIWARWIPTLMLGSADDRNSGESLSPGQEAFSEHAEQWADYTRSPKGRLRQRIVLHHLLRHLDSYQPGIRVLDAGGGTGEYTLALAQRGDRVCLLDFSQEMLQIALGIVEADAPSVMENIEFYCLRVEEATDHFPPESFDLILCHTFLEYVEEPMQALRSLATLLVPRGLISLLLANPFSDALRWALSKKDLERSLLCLRERVSQADLFGLTRRTIPLETVYEALAQIGVHVLGEYGVRVFADYLSGVEFSNDEFYAQLWRLEVAASELDPYKRISRYTHVVGVKSPAES